MKITLIIVLLQQGIITYSAGTTNTNSGITVTSAPPTDLNRKIVIPMPGLKECLDARHQIDGYQHLVVAACSAE